ncbi:16456_t:CDS:2 [Acaulospora colombiana]|uniref:16456_t:CDS:1 n=1 Tax=Acaulospora colombiana TaxID=27376 RepID=A0ACA9K6C1_9GLOM|nr:16456_t:CDS:2 [Acaulospora colombiana]
MIQPKIVLELMVYIMIRQEGGGELLDKKKEKINTIDEQRTLKRICVDNDKVDNEQVSVQMEDQSYNQIRVLEEGGVKYLEVKLNDKYNHVMLYDIEDYELSDKESKNEAIQFRKSIDAQRIQNITSKVNDLEEGEIYDPMEYEDINKDLSDHGYTQEDEDQISNFIELEENSIDIDHGDIDQEGIFDIELVPMNTSEHVNNQEYNVEGVFDFEKFNDDQFSEQSWIDRFLDM